jgi:hypothetical protein
MERHAAQKYSNIGEYWRELTTKKCDFAKVHVLIRLKRLALRKSGGQMAAKELLSISG